MACKCLTEVDAALREHGSTRLDPAIFVDGSQTRARVATCIPFFVKKKRGEKAKSVIADYCPFCGVKYG